jgi:type IV secretion system protein VirD4
MLLDEFTALGRIPIIAESVSYLPGYNVRVVLVIQTPAQLREVYGIHNAETLLKSLAARIVFAPKDFSDAREVSDELGYTTVKAKSLSRPLGAALDRRGSRGTSQTVSLQRRALLLPQEVKELGKDDAIVFYEGLRPIRCRKIRYFTDRRFSKRLLPPPERPVPVRRILPAQVLPLASAHTVPEVEDLMPSVPAPRKEEGVTREGTVDDIDRMETLTLADFATDFSKVKMPKHEPPIPDGEMKAAVDEFIDLLRES